jgi:hypothetical protein
VGRLVAANAQMDAPFTGADGAAEGNPAGADLGRGVMSDGTEIERHPIRGFP